MRIASSLLASSLLASSLLIALIGLAGACFLSPATAAAAESADPVQNALDRLAALDPASQQAWLKRLEDRANRAARLTAKPKEHAEQLAAIRDVLHQKAVSWDSLRDAIDATDELEKEAILVQSKKYRLKVFEVFHTELHVYGNLQREWQGLEEEWDAHGKPFETQDLVLDWLESAMKSVMAQNAGAIPKWPKLEPPPMPVKVKKPAPAKPQAVAKTPAPSVKAAETEIVKAPAAKAAQTEIEKAPAAKAAETEIVKAPAAKKPRPLESFSPAPESVIAPLVKAEGVFSLPPRREMQKTPADAVEQLLAAIPDAPKLADFELPPQKLSPIVQPTPPVSKAVLRELTKLDSPPELEPMPDRPADGDEADVVVNVDELSARISGCNLAFRALEAELNDRGAWSAARLDPLMKRLEILIVRRRDLDMFRETLSESQRRSVDALASEKDLVAQFAAKIVLAREAANGPDFQGADAERQNELTRLQELSRRLADLTQE